MFVKMQNDMVVNLKYVKHFLFEETRDGFDITFLVEGANKSDILVHNKYEDEVRAEEVYQELQDFMNWESIVALGEYEKLPPYQRTPKREFWQSRIPDITVTSNCELYINENAIFEMPKE